VARGTTLFGDSVFNKKWLFPEQKTLGILIIYMLLSSEYNYCHALELSKALGD